MASVDLVLKNGRIVSSDGIVDGVGIAIENGKIVSIANESNLPAANRVVDVKGKFIIPGLIDPHTHLGGYGDFEGDFKTETVSAACGGVTTLMTWLVSPEGNFFPPPASYFDGFEYSKSIAEKHAIIDFAFHTWVFNERHLVEIPQYTEKLGIPTFKFSIAETGPGTTPIDDRMLIRGLTMARDLGYPSIPMIHCENPQVFYMLSDQLKKQGRKDLAAWSEARPNYCEAEAVQRVLLFSKATQSPAYIVHLSIQEGVDAVARAKAEDVGVKVETCAHYLTLTKHENRGALGKLNPPLRDKQDIAALWHGIGNGIIDTIGSDHVAMNGKAKLEAGLWNSLVGLPGVETTLPVLLSEGVNKGRITLEKLVEISSLNPAKIFGVYPQKGAIKVGSDADLVVVDLDKTVKVSVDMLHSRSDYTMYEGWSFRGWPTLTISKGEVVMEDSLPVGRAGTGKYVPRKQPIKLVATTVPYSR